MILLINSRGVASYQEISTLKIYHLKLFVKVITFVNFYLLKAKRDEWNVTCCVHSCGGNLNPCREEPTLPIALVMNRRLFVI